VKFFTVPQFPQVTTGPTPPSGYDSLYFKSGDLLYRMNSSGVEAWVGDDGAAWTTWSPSFGADAGALTTVTSANGRYKKVNRVCNWQVTITVTNKGTATGNLYFTLPLTAASTVSVVGHGRENALAGVSLQAFFRSTTTSYVFQYNNGSVLTNGWVLVLAGAYETAT
jgi:hypothetical protein